MAHRVERAFKAIRDVEAAREACRCHCPRRLTAATAGTAEKKKRPIPVRTGEPRRKLIREVLDHTSFRVALPFDQKWLTLQIRKIGHADEGPFGASPDVDELRAVVLL